MYLAVAVLTVHANNKSHTPLVRFIEIQHIADMCTCTTTGNSSMTLLAQLRARFIQ
jgi:hypothetical protein